MQAGKRVCGLEQARHGMLSCFDEKTCRFILFLQYYLGFGLLAKRIVTYIWHLGHDKKKTGIGVCRSIGQTIEIMTNRWYRDISWCLKLFAASRGAWIIDLRID